MKIDGGSHYLRAVNDGTRTVNGYHAFSFGLWDENA